MMCSVFFYNGRKQLRKHLNQCAATNLHEDTCVSQGDYAYGECGWSGDDDIFSSHEHTIDSNLFVGTLGHAPSAQPG